MTTIRESGAAEAARPLMLSEINVSVAVTVAESPTVTEADDALNANVSSAALATGAETELSIPNVNAEITASEIRLKITLDISFLSEVVKKTFLFTAGKDKFLTT